MYQLSPASQYTSPCHRFVDRDMMMRYHLGLGVGHVYGYKCTGTPTAQSDSEGAAMAASANIWVDSDVDVSEEDHVEARESDSEESTPEDLNSLRSSVSDLVTSDEGSVDFEAVIDYNSEDLELLGLDDSQDIYKL